MSPAMQVVSIVVAVLAINLVLWAVLLPRIKAKGRRQVEKYGSAPTEYAADSVEHEGKGHYLGTRIDDAKYVAPGYWARGMGPVKLTERALLLQRGDRAAPMLVLREGIRSVERRSRFAGRGSMGDRITVIHWEMGGGRFSTGIVFLGREDERLAWERRLRESCA